MKFVDVSLENDMVVFVASLPKDIWEESFSLGTDVINSDKNLARVLNNVDHQFINKFIKAKTNIGRNRAIKVFKMPCLNIK